jgi:hypothetical protein
MKIAAEEQAAADIDKESLLQDLKRGKENLSRVSISIKCYIPSLLTSFSTHQQNQNISNGL